MASGFRLPDSSKTVRNRGWDENLESLEKEQGKRDRAEDRNHERFSKRDKFWARWQSFFEEQWPTEKWTNRDKGWRVLRGSTSWQHGNYLFENLL